jgi:hypothetical protein
LDGSPFQFRQLRLHLLGDERRDDHMSDNLYVFTRRVGRGTRGQQSIMVFAGDRGRADRLLSEELELIRTANPHSGQREPRGSWSVETIALDTEKVIRSFVTS